MRRSTGGTNSLSLAPEAFEPPASLTVVVATFRRPEPLERCIRALHTQTRPPDQIVVVCREDDPGSRDLARSLARELPIDVAICARPALCAQMDLGASIAHGDIVALTDDDAAPRPDWVERLLRHYRDADVGAVGGRDAIHDDPTVDSGPTRLPVGTVSRWGRPLGNHHHEGTRVRDVDFLKGVNLSIRRALWHVDTVLLGEGNQSHWELGTCLRIRWLGWRVIYDPELIVDHYAEARVGEPQRHSRDAYTLERDAHNELYELLRWLPLWKAVSAAIRAFSVGSKATPGLVSGFWLATHGYAPRDVLRQVQAATKGRIRALASRPRQDRVATLNTTAGAKSPRASGEVASR